ncbi:methyltransferase domain-containing protein [Synechococcus sp. MIT S9508]|uniref:methyltransferase domain-containing protein n=1 Tax=Synechococcus sp. MIT S9508 TaxID=1801629 RepID=UPI0007BB6C61|nr:methyltransferase domain-containing protein [Synechococcus sp. MIT S9508]KZR90554.1 Mg-protoporphyrin IX methyl transferase [Synechococcus sp. MIT S9508]
MDNFGKNSFADWRHYFQERALCSDIPGYYVNGFIDAALVRAIHKSVRHLLIQQQYQVVFDCGCGDGSVTAPIASSGIQVYGLDFSPAMCMRAERQGLIPVECDLLTLQHQNIFEYCGQSFLYPNSCLLFCESLGCIDMPLDFVARVIGSNVGNSDFVISFPNGSSLIRRAVSLFDSLKINYFDLFALTKAVKSSSALLPQNVLAIVSLPFVYSFVLDVNRCHPFLRSLLTLVASNYVVRFAPRV